MSTNPGLELSLVDSTTVRITVTAPSDPTYDTCEVHRRLVGGTFAKITEVASGTHDDTVTAERTYEYVLAAVTVADVLLGVSRAAAIRTVTSATVSGLLSIPVDALGTLLANCPGVQSFLGVGNEADALARIYPFIAGEVAEGAATSTQSGKLVDTSATFITNGVLAGDVVKNTTDKALTSVSSVDSETQLTLADDLFTSGEVYLVQVSRPLIIVGVPDDSFGRNRLADRVFWPDEGNELEVLFEKAITSGSEVAGRQREAWYSFGNELGAIIDEMEELAGTDDGSHIYLPISHISIKQGPGRPTRDDAASLGHCYGAILSVRWD